MTPETPLEEVAHRLPPDAATQLLSKSPCVQEKVLGYVRACFVYWEAGGYSFDPIALEGILNAIVALGAEASSEIERLELQALLLRLR